MADTKFSGLTAVTTLTGASELMLNEAGTSKRATVDQFVGFDRKLIAGGAGTANANAAPCETWQVLTSNAAATSSTSTTRIMETQSVPAGTYFFRYDIIAQSSATTTSLKFAVASAATVTKIVWHLFYPSQGVTAATGVVDQDINVTTGAVWAHLSSRTNSATGIGPTTQVDTIDADLHYVIEGVIVTTTQQSLGLYHASANAVSTQVMSGTMLRLSRLA